MYNLTKILKGIPMNKKILSIGAVALLATSLQAGKCSDGLKFDFTFFGAPDKSYVVTKNTFSKFVAKFPGNKLKGATLSIDGTSIDTSADLSNLKTKWSPAMVKIRNMNIKNHFFNKFAKDKAKVDAKIVKVSAKQIVANIAINGVKKDVAFSYKKAGNVLQAVGKLELNDFGLQGVWSTFSKICRPYHHGKSWSEVEVHFEVPASCK